MELTGYGRSTGFCVDPIEKKPLNHFLPGSAVLSFGTAGCNLACAFCQNWDISKSRETARLSAYAPPETIARAAERLGCASVAYTYNDPTIFLEYAVDTAEACRARGIKNVAVTAGFICEEPRKRLFAAMDAANVDLKAFTERFYEKRCAGQARPGARDAEISGPRDERLDRDHHAPHPRRERRRRGTRRADDWVAKELGPDVPLHFTAFHPDYHMLETGRRRSRPAAGAGDRARERPAPRLRRKRARPGAGGDAVPDLRDALHRPRPLRDHRVPPRRRRALPGLRDKMAGVFADRAGDAGGRDGCRWRSSATRVKS